MSILPENPILSLEGWSQMPAHLVISLPKCGGNTIVATLRSAFPRHPVAYVHVISRLGLTRAMDLWRDVIDQPAVQGHLNEAREARMMIEERRNQYGRPIGYYLCGVREPIGMALSGLFQAPAVAKMAAEKVTPQYVKEFLLNQHPVLSKQNFFQDGLDGWFDNEIKSVLGVDIFEYPFDSELGYRVICERGVKVLIVRQESFDCLPDAFAEFYDLPAQFFTVKDANRAKDKPIGDIYESVKSKLKFDGGFLDELYASRYCRHFYTEEELAAFRQKWSVSEK